MPEKIIIIQLNLQEASQQLLKEIFPQENTTQKNNRSLEQHNCLDPRSDLLKLDLAYKAQLIPQLLDSSFLVNQKLLQTAMTHYQNPSLMEKFHQLNYMSKTESTFHFLYQLCLDEDFAFYELLSAFNADKPSYDLGFLQELLDDPENWQKILLQYHLDRTIQGYRYNT